MASVATDQLYVELTVPVLCGDGYHDVTFSLNAWGRVSEVFNPCSEFPEVLRTLARSDCHKHVQAHVESLQAALQYCQCSGRGQRNLCCDLSAEALSTLNGFIARIQRSRVVLAEAVLRDSDLGDDLSDADALAAALDPSDEQLAWAITTLAGDRQISKLATPMVEKMPDFSPGLQANIVSALARLQAGPCISALERAVTDSRFIAPLRSKCAAVLGEKGTADSVICLTQANCAADREIRTAATDAIERILRRHLHPRKRNKAAASQALENTLAAAAANDETSDLKDLLCGFGGSVVPGLIATLTSHNPALRAAAAEVLASIGDLRACEPLLTLIDDPADSVRRTAGDALARLILKCADHGDADPEFLVRALRVGDGDVVSAAARTLGKMRERRAVEPLTEVLSDYPAVQGRIAAVEALGVICDRRAISTLADVVEHDNSGVRQPAVEAALRIIHSLRGNDPSVTQTLGPLVMHPHWLMACAAIAKIEETNIPQARPHMIKALEHPNDQPRATAAGALQRFGDPRAILALIRCSDDSGTQNYEPITQAAISLIRRLSADAAAHLPLLVQATKAGHVVIAVEAVRLLSAIKDPASVDALLRACLRGESELSAIAGPALSKLGGRKILTNLAKYLEYGDVQVARGIEDALVAVGGDAVPVLTKAIKWRCYVARATAARSLGRIGDQRALEHLKCARADGEKTVRIAAEIALKQLRMS